MFSKHNDTSAFRASVVLSALRYMDEIHHMYEMSKRGKFYFDSFLIVSHLNMNKRKASSNQS